MTPATADPAGHPRRSDAVALPIARVVVDVPLAHLDKPFDYLVAESQDAEALPGCRVRVRFAGQRVGGFILDRTAETDFTGRLSPLAGVVSAEPVLAPDVARLCRSVADHYAGTMADVLRLAIPPRNAAVEREVPAAQPQVPHPASIPNVDPSGWLAFRRGEAFLKALQERRSPRAAWTALPGLTGGAPAWMRGVVQAAFATLASGRTVLVVVPDQRDLELLATVFAAHQWEQVATLSAALGPRERYRRWLAIRRGQCSVVVGTRAAVYAPLAQLGLVVVWDDGDDLHAEPRAPYPHVREVAALRAHQSGAGLLIAGYARTAEVSALINRGFLHSVQPDRASLRSAAPRISATGDSASKTDRLAAAARLPTTAWRLAKDALQRGPVLFVVPRRGYVPRLVCEQCRAAASCSRCHGPMGLGSPSSSHGVAVRCEWCGLEEQNWHCEQCGGRRFRGAAIGAARTAEELGRAFPSVPVITSGGRQVRREVAQDPALVVCTPGAEPIAPEGYAAAVLLDAWALLGRPEMTAHAEAVRRWLNAAALVQPASSGGRLAIVGDAAARAVQAVVAWSPARFGDHELHDRQLVGLPPARRVALLRASRPAVTDLLSRVQLPSEAEVLGPVPGPDDAAQVLIRVPPASGMALSKALRAAQGERSVRKASEHVTVRIDPVGLL